MHEVRNVFVCGAVCLLLAGCSSQASRVSPVQIDPSDAGSGAMEMYDKDGDGAIGGDELDAVPGLKKNVARYDTNSDSKISRDEISQRISGWGSEKLALMGATYIVTLDGQALDGATVTLVPEAYIGENVKPASGVTGPTGLARLSHEDEFLPKTANGRPLSGVFGGTYKIQVTHPSRSIPAKYNTTTELGEEIAPDINPNDAPMRLALTSK
jgi:uncharacterized protein YceK